VCVNAFHSCKNNTFGLRINSSNDVLAVGNRITSSNYGIYFLVSTGKYMDNLTSNVTTAFTGGIDAGGNN